METVREKFDAEYLDDDDDDDDESLLVGDPYLDYLACDGLCSHVYDAGLSAALKKMRNPPIKKWPGYERAVEMYRRDVVAPMLPSDVTPEHVLTLLEFGAMVPERGRANFPYRNPLDINWTLIRSCISYMSTQLPHVAGELEQSAIDRTCLVKKFDAIIPSQVKLSEDDLKDFKGELFAIVHMLQDPSVTVAPEVRRPAQYRRLSAARQVYNRLKEELDKLDVNETTRYTTRTVARSELSSGLSSSRAVPYFLNNADLQLLVDNVTAGEAGAVYDRLTDDRRLFLFVSDADFDRALHRLSRAIYDEHVARSSGSFSRGGNRQRERNPDEDEPDEIRPKRPAAELTVQEVPANSQPASTRLEAPRTSNTECVCPCCGARHTASSSMSGDGNARDQEQQVDKLDDLDSIRHELDDVRHRVDELRQRVDELINVA